jgi:hypothetical protein
LCYAAPPEEEARPNSRSLSAEDVEAAAASKEAGRVEKRFDCAQSREAVNYHHHFLREVKKRESFLICQLVVTEKKAAKMVADCGATCAKYLLCLFNFTFFVSVY